MGDESGMIFLSQKIGDEAMRELKLNIEDFFERHNAKIQIIIFIVSLVIGAYFNICQNNQLGIIIGLLLLVSGELISLNIKDSITQRKLNNLGVKFEIERGALFRVHDFNLTDFFNKTKSQFFVSGIALNGFFEKNKSVIERFLAEGKEVFIVIANPDIVSENTKLYHGANLDVETFKKKTNDIYYKQIITLNCIDGIENIYKFMESGKFKLKVANSVISTSFVAYDIFEKEILSHNNRDGKELKASFYQYRCTNPINEPNIMVDSFLNRDWYLFFKNTIKVQWDDAQIISNRQQFEKLRQNINNKIIENSK
jgi:hypothetical protein